MMFVLTSTRVVQWTYTNQVNGLGMWAQPALYQLTGKLRPTIDMLKRP
jgi:hypothetical protein